MKTHGAAVSGRAHRGGFTLIEILIALTILVVGLVGLLALFPVAASSSNQSAQDSHGSILAKSIKNAVVDGVRSARIVTQNIGGVDVPFYEIPFQHSGVPHEGVSYGGVSTWAPDTDQNLGRNLQGTYYVALPVDPLTALESAGEIADATAPGTLDPSQSDYVGNWVYYFPRRGLIAGSIPAKSEVGAPVNDGAPADLIDKDAPGEQRVFYNGKWLNNSGTYVQTFKSPDRVLDLETGGRQDESEVDPYAQYAYRLEFRPVVEKRNISGSPTDVLVEGLWSCKVFIFRHYEEFDQADGAPNMVKRVTDAAGWYDFSTGIEENDCTNTFTFHVALR